MDIKWGGIFKKIMAQYQARIKQLEKESVMIEQERKLAAASAEEAKAQLDAAKKDPNIAPKDLLSLRIANEKKIIASSEKLIGQTNKELEIAQTFLNKNKFEVAANIKNAAEKKNIENESTRKALEATINTWLNTENVSTLYEAILAFDNMIEIKMGDKRIELVMESRSALDTLSGDVLQWQEHKDLLKVKINDAQKTLENNKNNLIKYENELQALQPQPKQMEF